MDREEVPLGVSDVSAECGDALQSRFVSRCTLGFEGGQRLEEEFESLVIVQGSKMDLFHEMVPSFDAVGDEVEQ